MRELVAGSELVFIGISLTDIDGTWKEEVSSRCGNFPEDYKKMLTTIDSHKLLKLTYKVGKLRVKLISDNLAKGFITSFDDEEELGATLTSSSPGYWTSDKTEFIEFNHFKEQLKDILNYGDIFLESIVNRVLAK